MAARRWISHCCLPSHFSRRLHPCAAVGHPRQICPLQYSCPSLPPSAAARCSRQLAKTPQSLVGLLGGRRRQEALGRRSLAAEPRRTCPPSEDRPKSPASAL